MTTSQFFVVRKRETRILLEKNFEPKRYEGEIYKTWEEKNLFAPSEDLSKKPFTIIMPPPNANGSLHLGHATFVTIEDIMIRYKRMCGYRTLWLPGTDHAGIQTQAVFERDVLMKQRNQTRFNLGREKFFEECYEFCMNSKFTIEGQFRKLGASCDWSREKFTLDPEISKQVMKTFKDLYRDGLVFKGKYLVNWCPRCGTTLSNIETDHKDEIDKIWEIKYKIKNSKNKNQNDNFVIVATTRPETMLGDTAVAVNPEDERYKNLVGKTLILPLMNREIPIIFDESVDMEFGTGCVKVTPAHDPVDYEIGKRHNLEMIEVIDKFDKITENGGVYVGMDKFEARKKILEDLKNLNLLGEEKPHKHEIRVCERCKTRTESLLSDEWYVDIKPMAKKAIEGIENGEVKILPDRSRKVLIDWLKEFQPWPISRQIWWSHRVPVWYKKEKLQNSKDKSKNESIEITLVRHGESEQNIVGNVFKNSAERNNCKLTENGRKQAEELAEKLKNEKFDVVFCSNANRAKETLEIILSKNKISEVYYSDLLNETKKEFENMVILENDKSECEKVISFETPEEVVLRTENFLKTEFEKLKGKKVLIVGHRAQFSSFAKIFPNEESLKGSIKNVFVVNINFNLSFFEKFRMTNDKNFLVSTTGKIETDLVVVRHGEAENNKLKIRNGDPKIDYHLTETGKKQAESLQDFFEGKVFDAVFVSEHVRTKETAEIALAKTKYEKLIVDELLNDKKTGKIDTISYDEYLEVLEDEQRKKELGVETIEEIQNRIKIFLKKIRENYKGKRVLIFTHSVIIRNLNILLKNFDPLNNANSSESLAKATPYFYTLYDEPTEELVQDEDTFDTWFSSGQWPVTTLGGPNPTEDFLNFYPTDVMETGWDIIFFWVARMLMLGKYMTGKFPFKNVYLHGLARDKNGLKMSKSKGNGIDPLVMIEKYGTDALRLALSVGSSAGEDFRIYEEKIEGMRNFVNKLWNAGRFLEMNFGDLVVIREYSELTQRSNDIATLTMNSRNCNIKNIWNVWILKKSLEVVREVTEDFENHRYGIAGEKIKNFTWNLFCDWYLEAIKNFVKTNFDETKFVASIVFSIILKLLHPFAPFVTEQLWGDLKISDKMLIESNWIDLSQFDWAKNLTGENEVEILKKTIEEIRSVFVDILERDNEVKSSVFSENQNEDSLLKYNLEILKNLSGIKNLEVLNLKTVSLKTPITNTISVEFELSDEKKEKAKIRVEKEIQKLEKYIVGIEGKLSNEAFVTNAPQEILENTRKILEESIQKIVKLKAIKF
ncbi:MAG: hypothetical protein Fur0024_3140 [Patescibacteria group bacterium]